jgi:hypothetical protein
VALLTAGWRGVPMLAASYGSECGLVVAALVPDYGRWSVEAAEERRDVDLVALADAAVVVWDARDAAVCRVLELAQRKGIPVHVLGAPPKRRARRVRDHGAWSVRWGLPD